MNKLSTKTTRKAEGVDSGSFLNKVRLHKSLGTLSILIENGNEELWPIFERLECELKRIDERVIKLSRYVNNQNLQ